MARHCNPDYGKTLQTRKWQDIAILKMAKYGDPDGDADLGKTDLGKT